MTLSEAQQHFAYMVGQFLTWIYTQPSLSVTFGDAYRTPEQASENAAHGTGIVNSLHCDRLAIDLNVFQNGIYQTDGCHYESLGEKWESLGGSWGGRFTTKDYNHFSLAWGGRR